MNDPIHWFEAPYDANKPEQKIEARKALAHRLEQIAIDLEPGYYSLVLTEYTETILHSDSKRGALAVRVTVVESPKFNDGTEQNDQT